MDARKAHELVHSELRLSSVLVQLLHADDALNAAAQVCLSDIAVPATLAAGVAQAKVRIQDVIGELRNLRRLMLDVALSETRAPRARKARRARRA
jgi:hypothetical protein